MPESSTNPSDFPNHDPVGPLDHYPESAAKAISRNEGTEKKPEPDWIEVFRGLAWTQSKTKVFRDPIQADDEGAAVARGYRGCGTKFIVGVTPEGQYFKRLYCGREWCPVCGQNGSVAHRRRAGRWYRAWYSMDVGWLYLVFTVPKDLHQYIGKDELRKLNDYIIRKLKRDLLRIYGKRAKGFTRWHFGGDRDKGYRYMPHLNVVLDHTYISQAYLQELKQGWADRLCEVVGGLEVSAPNAYAQYISRAKVGVEEKATRKVAHLLRYVTRATFHGPDERAREVISGFRNNRRFGWRKEDLKEVKGESEALHALQKIDWKTGQIVTEQEFHAIRKERGTRYLGLGIWTSAVPLSVPPPETPPPPE